MTQAPEIDKIIPETEAEEVTEPETSEVETEEAEPELETAETEDDGESEVEVEVEGGSGVSIQVEHNGTVLSVRAENAERCRIAIKKSYANANTAFFDLSQALLEAYDNDYAKDWGYPNFVAYAEAELSMKSSAAYGLVDVARNVRKYGIPRERVESIGWSKINQLTKALAEHPDDTERLLGMAESMSRSQLGEALKRELSITNARDAKAAIMRLSLKLEGDSATIVSDGFALAYNEIGKEDVSYALTHIVGEWLMARGGNVNSTTLEDWTAYLEKLYGVKLVRAETTESMDEILDATATTAAEDDAALEELLK